MLQLSTRVSARLEPVCVDEVHAGVLGSIDELRLELWVALHVAMGSSATRRFYPRAPMTKRARTCVLKAHSSRSTLG